MNDIASNISATHIFIVGMSRSGTTLMARILNQHSNIFSFNELHFLERDVDPRIFNTENSITISHATTITNNLLYRQRIDFFATPDQELYREEASSIVKELTENFTPASLIGEILAHETKLNGKKISCEQTPKNVFYLQELFLAYPNAIVINMVRDPRDVLLSQRNRWQRRFHGADSHPLIKETLRSWANYHPITMTKLWNSSINAANTFYDNGNIIHIRYEDLVSEPTDIIRLICQSLKISFEPDMLNVGKVGSSHRPDENNLSGIDKSNTQKWCRPTGGLPSSEVNLCEVIAQNNMQLHEYPLSKTHGHVIEKIVLLLTFPVKLSLSLALNFHRSKNILHTIKKRFFD